MLRIFYIIAVVLIIFSGFVATRPDDFRVSRSITIEGSKDDIFNQINELKKWDAWSPWAKIDPNAKSSFEGPESGVGAVMSWDGNAEVGKGSMTVTQSTRGEFIQFRMDFLKPMESVSTTEFTLTPEGKQTTVKWEMYGKNNFIGKAIGIIFNCDKMVGEKFEEGLANLKAIIEKK